MFTFLKRPFFKERKIEEQVHVFLKWRAKRNMPVMDYAHWLNLFLNFTDKGDVLDVTVEDVVKFVELVFETHNGSRYKQHKAEVAIRQFRRYYSARGNQVTDDRDYSDMLMQAGVGFVADVKRNKQIVELRLKDPKKWSWRKLGEKFNIDFTTARHIFIRDRLKYGPKYDLFRGN